MNPQLNLALQLVPLVDAGRAYPLVDEAIALIAATGLRFQVTPFNTVVEGSLAQLQQLVADLHALMQQRLAPGEEYLLNTQWHGAAGKSLNLASKTAGQPVFEISQ